MENLDKRIVDQLKKTQRDSYKCPDGDRVRIGEGMEFMSKKGWILATGAAIWALALLGYLAVMPATTSMVLGSINGLEVIGQAAARGGPARFTSDGMTATIQLGSQTARVSAHDIEVTGGRIIPVPATCKQIRLFETRNDIRILFEGDEPSLSFTTGAFTFIELTLISKHPQGGW